MKLTVGDLLLALEIPPVDIQILIIQYFPLKLQVACMKRFVTSVYLQAFVSPENNALCFHPSSLIFDWFDLPSACLGFLTIYDLHGPGKS